MRLPGGHLAFTDDPVSERGLLVLAERRYLAQLQPTGLINCLGRRAVTVTVIDDNEVPGSWLEHAGLVVARGRSAPLLAALRTAEAAGVTTLNRSAAIGAVRDKAAMATALVAAGIPTPPTWVGSQAELASTLPATTYPLIVKPVFGDNGRSVVRVDDPHQLRTMPWPEPVALAQPLVPSDGHDVKVYAVGEQLWAVRAPSPFRPAAAPQPVPISLSTELAEVARACGRLFGLELFGVDCLITPAGLRGPNAMEGPVVIEVNDFPNYRGVPEADEVLAGYVMSLRGAA